jgi:hypothetical protein
MTSEADIIASIISAQTYLYRLGGPILMVIGTVSCILNLIIFMKKNLRKNPCSIYLIAFNVTNLLLVYTSLFLSTLSYGFNTNLPSYNLGFCHFDLYIGFLLDILSPFYLILASVDRVLVTSRNARTRKRSTHRLAYICIISGTIFWSLYHIHALIFSNIIEILPNYFICYFATNTYLEYTSYYSLIVKAFLVPLCMIVLGLRTIRNVRSVGRAQVAPALSTTRTGEGNAVQSPHSKDRQLIKILTINIGVYLIFNLMLSSILLYDQITQNWVKSALQSQIDLFLLYVSLFSSYISFSIGCYTNLWVSKTFRSEIKNVLLCK